MNVDVSGFTPANSDSRRDWIASFFPIKDHNQRVRAINVVVQDITERNRAEKMFRDLLESAPDAMVIIDAEHLCLSMRGVKKSGANTVTSAVRGIFRTKESTRMELLELIKKRV